MCDSHINWFLNSLLLSFAFTSSVVVTLELDDIHPKNNYVWPLFAYVFSFRGAT